MRVLILGSNSMAGHVIKEYLSNYSKFELSKIIYLSIIHEYSGLYQVGSKQKISKFDLLNLIKKQWNKKNISISKVEGQKINRSLLDTKEYFNIVDYEKMFKELYKYMKKRNLTYSHYNELI